MLLNPCQAFEPHEPHVTLVEYDMCSPLLFPHTLDFRKVAPKIDGVTDELLERLIEVLGI